VRRGWRRAASAPRLSLRRVRKGVDLKALSFSVLAGVIIWLLPAPVGVSLKAWHLLAHFVATIVGIITSVRATAWERRRLEPNPTRWPEAGRRPPPAAARGASPAFPRARGLAARAGAAAKPPVHPHPGLATQG